MTAPSVPLNLAALEKAALAATPGEWQRSGIVGNVNEKAFQVGPDNFGIIYLPVGKSDAEYFGAMRDADFIAAANPQTVRALVARIRKLEGALKSFASVMEKNVHTQDAEFPADIGMMNGNVCQQVFKGLCVRHFWDAAEALSDTGAQ